MESLALKPTLDTFYHQILIPTVQYAQVRKFRLEELHHAFAIVSTRAFQVDAYHRIAMIPIADA